MSLPGLDLAQPSAEREFTPAPPTQVSLAKGSEWRFEVAFGTTVRVKVSNDISNQLESVQVFNVNVRGFLV